ncbi:MAG: hypothetical protein JSU63_02340 [Phycisphaerales bacterium]|nr:MAG: hypothetical protein JSU63_02340 [Phycisphaerales bacterium]
MKLVGLVILAIGVASAQAGAEIDVELRLLVLDMPSGVETTTDLSTLPGQTCVAAVNDSLVLEFWVSDVGSVNTGILGFYTDLTFENTLLHADALVHSSLFDAFLEGEIDNGTGRVIDFGGIDGTFTGYGVAPEWAKIGHVEMTAIDEGVATIVSSLGLAGFGVVGRPSPPVSDVQFGVAAVGIPFLPGDFDQNCAVDLDDFNQFQSCFTGPGGGPVGAECAPGDFDGDGDVDCDDWDQFVVAWTEAGDPPTLSECGAVPAVSEWGFVMTSLLVLTAGTLMYGRRRAERA